MQNRHNLNQICNMPLPNTTNVSKIVRFLKKENPTMKHDQIIAIALDKVRKKKKKKK